MFDQQKSTGCESGAIFRESWDSHRSPVTRKLKNAPGGFMLP